MQCLLCVAVILTVKKYNEHQHYSTHNDNKYAKSENEPRNIASKKLKEEKQKQKLFFYQVIYQGKATTEASYKAAYLFKGNLLAMQCYQSCTTLRSR